VEAEVRLRAACRKDIRSILRVQEASAGAAAWSAADYESLLAESSGLLYIAEAADVVGFLVGRLAADELEILNAAVSPDQRGSGVGSRLLRLILEEAVRRGARSAWLEVRESNQRARLFYRSFGFQQAYRRPRFYRNPDEDGVVYRRVLDSRTAA
jgi:ribosomal-protein-alanine N-acetyltransferase